MHYQIPPHALMELFHSNIWWYDNIELIINGFTYSRAYELYKKISNVWVTYETSEHHTFLF